MDPFSHALLGAASGHAAARSHRKAAALAGAAGALLPDADVLVPSASDPLLALEYHRHFSHALVISPLVALIASALLPVCPPLTKYVPMMEESTPIPRTIKGKTIHARLLPVAW